MEKSFLNFKAAHPEWTPKDPSGSLYLSRMADLNTGMGLGLGRRRLFRRSGDFSSGGFESTTGENPHDKAGEYDRALKHSQSARRRPSGGLMQSRVGGPSSSSIFQSGVGLGVAQTAILEDSTMSSTLEPNNLTGLTSTTIPEEDLAADGGVGSMLGESYVDGRRPKGSSSVAQSQQEEDEQLEDGGVLGLLAQIYGTGVNVKGRGRGPPRAI